MIDHIDEFLRWSSNEVGDIHPVVDRMLTTPQIYYALIWIKIALLIGSIRYDAPLDPMRIYKVDPHRIDRSVTWTRIPADKKANEHPRFRPPHYRLAARVFDGEWDRIDAHVSNSTVYQSFAAHFSHGVSWEETEFYELTLDAIQEGNSLWDCTTQSDLDERCKHIDELYQRIATDGYKTQDELFTSGDPNTSRYHIHRVIWDEITVNVGRDGEFIFQDGRNRLAIARILDLEEIPVVILVRHEQWQQKRDRIVRGELTASDVPEDLRTHPDLVDLF